MTYVALLRGINVGGNNKIEMVKLKKTFEQVGFSSVISYINSGNVIFKTELNQKLLADIIEKAILTDFGLNIPVVVTSSKTLQSINNEIPTKWVNDKEQKTDVMFLWDEVNKPGVIKQFNINPKIERLIYVDGALVWNIDRKYINRGEMIKIISTSLYKQMTIRNINTVRKLATMMEKV